MHLPEELPETKSTQDTATQAQLIFLKSLGYTGPTNLTKNEASNKINELKKLPRQTNPATVKQINFLLKLGYTGSTNLTKSEASKKIEELKNQQSKAPKNDGPDEHIPDWL